MKKQLILPLLFLSACSTTQFPLHTCTDENGNELNALRVFEYEGESGLFQQADVKASGFITVQCGKGVNAKIEYKGRDVNVQNDQPNGQ